MKSKKILSLLLALIMIISCAPIYASAAINLTQWNTLIVPPSISKTEMTYGETLSSIEVIGGELYYVDPNTKVETKIEGHFEFSQPTAKPQAMDAYKPGFKFIPDDTTTYATANISPTLFQNSIKSGEFPTIKVDGTDAFILEAPTATEITTGDRLIKSKFSGGKVVDAAGNDITSTGKWAWVSVGTTPSESGYHPAYWSATGYDRPTIDVYVATKALPVTMSVVPTVSVIKGQSTSDAVFTGGVILDESGTDITAIGKWGFNTWAVPEETDDPYVIKWSATGYQTVTATVKVQVLVYKATLAEAPTVGYNLDPGTKLNAAYIKPGTGKVVDENGNDITANGKWAVDKTQVSNDVLIWRDTTVPVIWTAAGYQSVTAQMAVGCNQPEAYYIDAVPTFAEAGQTLKYTPKLTWGSLTFIPGKATDKVTGEEIPGTYELYTDVRYTNRAENILIGVSNVYSYGKEAKYCFVKFVPTDTSLPAHEFGTSSRVYCDKGDFTLVEGTEVVVMHGEDKTALVKSGSEDDLKFSTFKTEPEGVEIKSVVWDKSVFDPSTADYGTVTMVEARVTAAYGFNEQVLTVPVRIMPYVYDYTNPWYGWSTSLMFWSTFQEEPDGIRNYKVDFTNKRLKGTVDLYVNDELITSVTPDENGKFYAEGQWIAPASGDYTYRYEYKPTPEDTATVTNPIYPTGESKDFTIELRPYRTLTINVGDQVYTITDRAGSRIYFNWLDETGLKLEDFSSWTFTDPNGKEFTPEKALESEDDPKQKASIHIIMPDHDTTATAKGTSIDGDVSSDGGLGSLWSFWQKLINFIVEIYRTIMDFFVPAVETY